MDGGRALGRPGRRAEPPVRRGALGHPTHRQRPHRGRGPEKAPPPHRTPSSLRRSPGDERTTRDGIPVTTAPRTLLDLAAVLKPDELDRALNEAETQRLPGPQPLLDRYQGHRGTATLRTLLLNARRSLRSPLEAEFLDFVAAYNLPPPFPSPAHSQPSSHPHSAHDQHQPVQERQSHRRRGDRLQDPRVPARQARQGRRVRAHEAAPRVRRRGDRPHVPRGGEVPARPHRGAQDAVPLRRRHRRALHGRGVLRADRDPGAERRGAR